MLILTRMALSAITEHAASSWPEECCGLLLARREDGPGAVTMARACTNRQADSRSGYDLDFLEVVRAREQGFRVPGIYHSHPDRSARFSAMDRELALGPDQRPLVGGLAHLVVSVRGGEAVDIGCFAWDPELSDFVEMEIQVEDHSSG